MRSLTFAMLKPDVTESGAFLEILDLVRQHFTIVGIRIHQMSFGEAAAFYAEHEGRPFFPGLVVQMSSGPVVAMVLSTEEGDAITKWRALIGATDPAKAEAGTIRSRWGRAGSRNAAHGSDSAESALREMYAFFGDGLETITSV